MHQQFSLKATDVIKTMNVLQLAQVNILFQQLSELCLQSTPLDNGQTLIDVGVESLKLPLSCLLSSVKAFESILLLHKERVDGLIESLMLLQLFFDVPEAT